MAAVVEGRVGVSILKPRNLESLAVPSLTAAPRRQPPQARMMQKLESGERRKPEPVSRSDMV